MAKVPWHVKQQLTSCFRCHTTTWRSHHMHRLTCNTLLSRPLAMTAPFSNVSLREGENSASGFKAHSKLTWTHDTSPPMARSSSSSSTSPVSCRCRQKHGHLDFHIVHSGCSAHREYGSTACQAISCRYHPGPQNRQSGVHSLQPPFRSQP